ncbi:hypothetical protein PIIN_09784 [Serendipita indica DSM 11827]|uniref:Lectin n=1 Tax=Serendipita indica (strain DSM 11827) TaxID=1109443 RepID=G4TWV3_SERID|nr:hypothetical protein PIIN_09784 [Serendipita indica DSM 11827]
MAYQITVRVFQTNSNAFFRCVEQSVFSSGTWTSTSDTYVLNMTGSGTSGSLRLEADTGERIIAVFGVHNYKRWCDIVTALTPADSGTKLLPEWYVEGTDRGKVKWSQLAEYSVTSTAPRARKYSIKYVVADGNNLVANLTIGWSVLIYLALSITHRFSRATLESNRFVNVINK